MIGAIEVAAGGASSAMAGIGVYAFLHVQAHTGEDGVFGYLLAGVFGLWSVALLSAGFLLWRGGRWSWTGQLVPIALVALSIVDADSMMMAGAYLALPLALLR